jgi:hypothetical protein
MDLAYLHRDKPVEAPRSSLPSFRIPSERRVYDGHDAGTGRILRMVNVDGHLSHDCLAQDLVVDPLATWVRPAAVEVDVLDEGGFYVEGGCAGGNAGPRRTVWPLENATDARGSPGPGDADGDADGFGVGVGVGVHGGSVGGAGCETVMTTGIGWQLGLVLPLGSAIEADQAPLAFAD